MNIPQEVRERIFVLYWGQEILKIHSGWNRCTLIDGWKFTDPRPKAFLEVTPLEMITDEDALQVGRIISLSFGEATVFRAEDKVSIKGDKWEVWIGSKLGPLDRGLVWFSGGIFQNIYPNEIIAACDYLRSRGYALPAFGYTVQQLVEAGIFKLKTTDHAIQNK